MNRQEARLFVPRYVSREYAPGEHDAFLGWLKEASVEEMEAVIGEYETLQDRWPLSEGPSAQWMAQMKERLDSAEAREKQAPVRRMPGVFKRFGWVAAASLLFISTGAYLWYAYRSGSIPGSSAKTAETILNTVVPRGGQQKEMLLADGSRVWLNAASSLSYPSSFSGKDRVIELSGEAYFEVAPDADRPFQVRSRNVAVQVLGTRFNVEAFEEEGLSKTSLIDGSVKVTSGSETVVLKPGDQAEVSYNAESNLPANGNPGIKVTSGLNVEQLLSWKDGYMEFNNDDLQTVMREISRYYDLDIRYEGNIPERRFVGKFPRSAGIDQILKVLEVQHIHFKISGKVITVMP